MHQLKAWIAGVFGKRRTNSIRSRGSSRLGLELLENRLTPADFQWAGMQGAVWSNLQSWTVNNVPAVNLPGANDTVFFTNASNTDARVDANFAGTVSGIVLDGYTGTITMLRNLTVADLTVSSGTITGAFSITITGMNSVWSGGTLRGDRNPANSNLFVQAGAAFTITSSVNLDGRMIQNSGTIGWTADSTITTSNEAEINNLSVGTFRVLNSVNNQNNNVTGTATLSGNDPFYNYGQFVIDADVTCNLSVPLTSYQGNFLVDGQMHVNQAATFLGQSANQQQVTFNGNGVLAFQSSFQANDIVTNVSLLEFHGDTTLAGTMDVQSGTVKIDSGLTITGGILDIKAGTDVQWSGGDIVLNAGAIIKNNGDFSFETGGSISGTGSFNNTSQILVDSAASVMVSAPFSNGQTLTLQRGTLILDTNQWSQASKVNFSGGNLQVNGVFTNAGTIEVSEDAQVAADTFVNDGTIEFKDPRGLTPVLHTLTVAARPNFAGGNFTQGATGVLSFVLGGTNLSNRLVVNGNATLDGTMRLVVAIVYNPVTWSYEPVPIPLNWSWTLITANQVQQQFATVDQLPPGFMFSLPTYGPGTFRVQNPDLHIPGGQLTDENTPLVFLAANGNGINIPIANADDALLQITLAVSHRKLTLGSLSGLSFLTGDGTSDATMTFTGTIAALNAALAGLIYTPDSNYLGSDALTITTTDTLASGGSYYDFDSIAIWVMEEVIINPPPPPPPPPLP